ncbi:hypothetical protein QCA50_014632 [Cerrena zonata]|uniref:Inner membrane component domain-containing protein n=1 Tax=Cerrena zonata TaxID=2478898 RepID=A0AAW0FSZ4_9APHY
MSGIPARDSSGSRDELADDPSQAVAAGAEPSSSSATHGTTPTQSSRFPSSLSHTAQRLPIHRSLSQSSHHHWSPNETPTHHHQGTSYFNLSSTRPTSPRRTNFSHSTRTMSAASVKRRGARSTSVASSHATNRGYRDDGELVSEEEHSDDTEHAEGRDGESYRRNHSSDRHRDESGEGDEYDEGESQREEDPITLRDRQSLINVEHPFGLPIWKPALYKKSRSVTRYADQALHSVPSAQAERHLLPGNIFWAVFFGWWLALACLFVSAVLFIIPAGGRRFSSLFFGLGWYLVWPFGKYVEGELGEGSLPEDEEQVPCFSHGNSSNGYGI